MASTECDPFFETLIAPWTGFLRITGFFPFHQYPASRSKRALRIAWSSVFFLGNLVHFACIRVPFFKTLPMHDIFTVARIICEVSAGIITLFGSLFVMIRLQTIMTIIKKFGRFLDYLSKNDRRFLVMMLIVLTVLSGSSRIYNSWMTWQDVVISIKADGQRSIPSAPYFSDILFVITSLFSEITFWSLEVFTLLMFLVLILIIRLFTRLNRNLEVTDVPFGRKAALDIVAVDRCLEDHALLTDTGLELERALAINNFFMYANDFLWGFFGICSFRAGEASAQPTNVTQAFLYTVLFCVIRTALMISAHERSQVAATILQSYINNETGKDRKSYLFMHFHRMMTRSLIFTTYGMVGINRTFIASVVGVVVTYGLLVMEMGSNKCILPNPKPLLTIVHNDLVAFIGNYTLGTDFAN